MPYRRKTDREALCNCCRLERHLILRHQGQAPQIADDSAREQGNEHNSSYHYFDNHMQFPYLHQYQSFCKHVDIDGSKEIKEITNKK